MSSLPVKISFEQATIKTPEVYAPDLMPNINTLPVIKTVLILSVVCG